jgi:AcrR family transcriptional regulator
MSVPLPNISIHITSTLYLKDPNTSVLGKKILTNSILLLEEAGFEQFTFKKLAENIGSTEASVYRYFESKHKLLLYLVNWYWTWFEYRLAFATANIPSATTRLRKVLRLLTENVEEDNNFDYIDETRLHRIVLSESLKTYLRKEVDSDNEEGAFLAYKKVVQSVSDIVLEIDPAYKYPHMLVSTVIEASHLQRYFADHLPRLTDMLKGEDSIVSFYEHMVLKTLGIDE